jgi:hypothetical protein
VSKGARLITQSGVYDIAPIAVDPATASAPVVVMIQKPDTLEYYYVSYRHPMGMDSGIDNTYYDHVTVHRYAGDGSPSKTILLAGLQAGEQFTDQLNGIMVTVVAHDATRATVQIDVTAQAQQLFTP